MKTEHIYQDRETMFRALRDFCLQALRSDLREHEEVSWFLSGGSTPGPLYSMLAQATLPWNRVSTALVDERWVDPGSPASNEGLLRRAFRDNADLLQNLTGMVIPHLSAAQAETQCNARYNALPGHYSLCLLGIGPDGHTASWFPGADGLHEALDTRQLCKAIMAKPSEVTGENIERMTLSLHAVLRCRRIVLMFTGAAKREVYARALACHDNEQLPVSAVLRAQGHVIDVFHSP